MPLLEIIGLRAGYSGITVLHDLSLALSAGHIGALIGRNGAGKSTTLKAIMGLLPHCDGELRFNAHDLQAMHCTQRAQKGIAYVPEDRAIFPSLSVRENLQIPRPGNISGRFHWPLQAVLELFPQLALRLGNAAHQLSGGEQQMLSIGRALLMHPKLLLLDEPTEGLAPKMVQQLATALQHLRDHGIAVLLVEQNIGFACQLADQLYVLGQGRIQWQGNATALTANKLLQQRWLGV